MVRRRARVELTPKQRILALGGLFGAIGLALVVVIGLSRVVGAEYGEPCQGTFLACRNQGFNDARCLTSAGGTKTCTRLCETATDCPRGHVCDYGVWMKGGRDTGYGRVERVCVAP